MMLLLVALTFVQCLHGVVTAETPEGRLLQDLFADSTYDKRQRPVNTSHPTAVEATVSLSVQALQHVNERTQMITINTWMSLEWSDYRLTWDPAQFNDTRHISLQTNDLWTPRVVLENTADRKVELPILDDFSRVLVGFDGVVLYDSAETISSLCSIDVANFPFDQQNCSLNFTNLADSIDLVKLKPYAKLQRYQYDKTQWKLVHVIGKGTIVDDPFNLSGDLKYSYVHFEIILKRQPVYHLSTSALPSTILTLLSFTVFLMPPECGERLSLGVSILLGLTVFQLVVSSTLPETGSGDSPLLGTYLTMNFTVVAAILFCTSLSMSVYSQPGPVRNRFARKVFLELLPPVLHVKRSKHDENDHLLKTPLVVEATVVNPQDENQDSSDKESALRITQSSNCSESSNQNEHEESEVSWRDERWIITMVLDRICFIMTATVFIFTTIALGFRLL